MAAAARDARNLRISPNAERFSPGRAACGQSHAAFPSQEGWEPGIPVPHPSRSGVSAVLAPRSGSPSQKGWGSGGPAPRPFRSGVSAVLAPRSGSPSQKGWGSGGPAPRPFRSGVSAVLAPRSGSPSQKGWGSGGPAPRPFRSGVSAVLAPRSGSERRCTPTGPHRENWPPRFAWLIVALRSKYTRASSPGGGSSLARLVSRAPHHSRCSRHFVYRLPAARIATRFTPRFFVGRGNPSLYPAPAALRAAGSRWATFATGLR